MIQYISTRGGGDPQSFEDVVLTGLAPDGGLYVPTEWPQLDLPKLQEIYAKGGDSVYVDIAVEVIAPFVAENFSREELREILEESYGPDVFRDRQIVPVHQLGPNLHVAELFCGPTLAFKDYPLQPLGRFFDHILQKMHDRIAEERGIDPKTSDPLTRTTIIGATSGDTGSAADEAVRGSRFIDIFMMFPNGRVSDVQRRQMTTIADGNVHNVAIDGDFDDCQRMVKALFNDASFRDSMHLSAVNSINWARVMVQTVYYVTTALKLGAPETKPTFVVPTGNFGNVLAGYYARKMGLPINLGIASNENDILPRFFETGRMEKKGVEATISPSIDIEVSSNFERYLYDLVGQDAQKVAELMVQFREEGHFSVPPELLEAAQDEFQAFRTNREGTVSTMKAVHSDTGYVLDPHTAVGMSGAMEIVESTDGPVVVLATAHPAKFPAIVKEAVGVEPELPPHLSDIHERQERFEELPNNVDEVRTYMLEHAPIASHE